MWINNKFCKKFLCRWEWRSCRWDKFISFPPSPVWEAPCLTGHFHSQTPWIINVSHSWAEILLETERRAWRVSKDSHLQHLLVFLFRVGMKAYTLLGCCYVKKIKRNLNLRSSNFSIDIFMCVIINVCLINCFRRPITIKVAQHISSNPTIVIYMSVSLLKILCQQSF